MTSEQEKLQRYHKAQKRVEEIKKFYIHLMCYLVIMPFLIYINYVTYWDYQWFWFSLIGWGIGVATHALVVFGFGSNWEERKIRQVMQEEERKENANKSKYL